MGVKKDRIKGAGGSWKNIKIKSVVKRGSFMAKERLSKLQKWILKRCYKSTLDEYVIWRYSILQFFGLDSYYGNGRNKAEASITRSLKNLFKKGYIDLALGNLGGRYSLEESRKAIAAAKRDIKEVEETGKPIISGFTGEVFDAKHIRGRIAEIEKEIREGTLRDTLMGRNIHRLKLTDKGIELVKGLKVKNNTHLKLNIKERNSLVD